MAEKPNKIQPRQIRMSDATKAKIDELAGELGVTTAEAIEMLVNEHGLELTKQSVPEQAAQVDQFKLYTRGMIELFENSVQLYAGAKDVARAEFAEQLQVQAVTINEQTQRLAEREKTIRSSEPVS